MIIDHVGLAVGDYEKSKQFFSRALAPLGIELVMEIGGYAGFGKGGKPEFWFGADGETQRAMHIAFISDNRDQSKPFTPRRWRPAARTTALPASARSITSTISAPS